MSRLGDPVPVPIRDRDIRNPLPKLPNLELRTWINGLPPGRIGDPVPTPIRNRDWPNPLPQFQNLELRTWTHSQQIVPAVTAPFAQRDWQNPAPARQNLELRTWTHTQQIPDATTSPVIEMSWENPPFGPIPGVELKTWTRGLPPGVIALTLPPIRDQNIPNPIPGPPNLELRTWIETLPPGVIALTIPKAQWDWPNPQPKPPNLELRTWKQSPYIPPVVQSPFNQFDWPNPLPKLPNLELRNWAQSIDLSAVTITVPNVVGETQAQATTDITAVGLGVTVVTAYSDTVAAGLVISQVPTAGSSATIGDIVIITVSLGAFVPPPPSTDQPVGGWGFWVGYEQEQRRRLIERKRRKELEDETEKIPQATDREIARILREQEAQDARRAELDRLGDIARRHADLAEARAYSERVAAALERAIAKSTFSALEALDREIERAQTEEELVILISQMIAEDQ